MKIFFFFMISFVLAAAANAETRSGFETEYDDFTDEPSHELTFMTNDTTSPTGFAKLEALCSKEIREIHAGVGIHFGLDDKAAVTYRLDSVTPVTKNWTYNTDDNLAVSQDSEDFTLVEQMLAGEKFVIQVETDRAWFDLAGHKQSIQTFLDACTTLP